MKPICFVIFCLLVKGSIAQTLPCLNQPFCNYHLQQTFSVFTNIQKSVDVSYGRTDTAWKDVEYSADKKANDDDADDAGGVSADACINHNLCIHDYDGVLKYNVYYPTPYDYSCVPLPCIIFVHGGGISDCSNYVLPGAELEALLYGFAKRGFVVFNVEYRRGRILDPNTVNGFPQSSVQQEMANYKAAQDVRGAIRTIIHKQLYENLDYKIDINRIYLAGNSGGSVAVLGSVFYQSQAMINKVFPKATTSPLLEKALGKINAQYYVGDSSIEYFSKIKGILNLWGSISVPKDVDTDAEVATFFSSNTVDIPPIISFHGKQDPVLPSGQTFIYFSPDINMHKFYNLTSVCPVETSALFQTEPNQAFNTAQRDLIMLGSESLHRILLTNMSVKSELYIDCQMRHGFENGRTGGGSDGRDYFGLGIGSMKSDIYEYIVQRACAFFQAADALTFTGMPPKKDFYECRNERERCSDQDVYEVVCCDPCNNTTTDRHCGKNPN